MRGRRTAIILIATLVLAPVAILFFNRNPAAATQPVTIGSARLDAIVIATRDGRRDALAQRTQVRPFIPFLIAEARPRYLHFPPMHVARRLDVVFLDGAGKVVDSKLLSPDADEGVTSAAEAQYALFLEAGQADKIGAKAGVAATLPPGLAPEERHAVTFKGKDAAAYVEVVNTHETQRRGVMYRDAMSSDDGMLFKYGSVRPAGKGHWMKNCRYPLTTAFVGPDGVIVTLVNMKPHDETNYPATAPWQYALEMNLGWFARHDIVEGDRLILPPDVRALAADD